MESNYHNLSEDLKKKLRMQRFTHEDSHINTTDSIKVIYPYSRSWRKKI